MTLSPSSDDTATNAQDMAVSPEVAKRFDVWMTKEPLAEAIVRHVEKMRDPFKAGPRVLDPGCGSGVFGRAVRKVWPDAFIVGIDIRKSIPAGIDHAYDELHLGVSFLDWEPQDGSGFDVIIGNPPFSKPTPNIAEAFIHHAIPLLKDEQSILAFLLRLNFWGGQERYETLWSYRKPFSVDAFPKRPSFGLNKHGKPGTDGQEYAAFLWDRTSTGLTQTLLGHLKW